MDEAQRLDMKAWLYDEGGLPSGSATGRAVRSNPAFGAQTLVTERVPLGADEKPAPPAGAVTAFVELLGRKIIHIQAVAGTVRTEVAGHGQNAHCEELVFCMSCNCS